jgi:hydroxypyruvate reductase
MVQELAGSPVPVRLWGGESTVRLPQAPGRGGRNQHLALAAARLMAGSALLLLAAGTDGTDGPTQEAGALVDGGTMARLARAAIDPEASLARADSGTALSAAGDLITLGPTGTNVGDLCIGLSLSGAA